MIGFLLRTLFTASLLLMGALFLLGSLFLQDEPLLPPMAAPSPEDVRAAQAFVHQVRRATEASGTADEQVSLTISALGGGLRMGHRFLRDYRADASIEADRVQAVASVPLRWPGGRKWLNAKVIVPPFEGSFLPSTVEVGGRSLSPELSVRLARLGANLLFGNRAGDIILDSAAGMWIDNDTMNFALALDRDDRSTVMQGVFGTMRGNDMPSPESIERHYKLVRDAMDAGRLPTQGSFLPHIRFALLAASEDDHASSPSNAYTAALFGLANACGAVEFGTVVGGLATIETTGTWRTNCNELTLADRVDLRRHFITAAAIKAASARGFAVSLGEFKELRDSLNRRQGFDFTDIAANNSGIRLSELFLSQPPENWTALIARIEEEQDLLPNLDGVPGLMPRNQFEARFGDIDSPEYQAMLAFIEERIDQLPLHRASN